MIDHLDPSIVAVPFYFAGIAWERKVLRRQRAEGRDVGGYTRPDTIASLGMGAVSVLSVGVLNLAIYAIATWLWQWRIFDLGNGVVGWVAAMVGWDFVFYWAHRWEHEIRFFWTQHVNHHSSRHYNLSTALRQPWLPVINLGLFPLLALVGVRPWMIMVAGGFNLIYQFWFHTEAIDRMPRWFEFVLNTPSHHRVHHASNPQYLDRNHGGILIIWDRLFGTFGAEGERPRYGLTKDNPPDRLWAIFSHEKAALWRDVRGAANWRDRLGHLFRSPGWTPNA